MIGLQMPFQNPAFFLESQIVQHLPEMFAQLTI
jgi:hypothetical protein